MAFSINDLNYEKDSKERMPWEHYIEEFSKADPAEIAGRLSLPYDEEKKVLTLKFLQSFGNMSRGNDNRPQSVNRPQNNGGFGNQSSSFGNQNRQFGNRQSSTRTTVTRENPSNNSRPGGFFGGNRGGFGSGSSMMRSFGSGNTTSPSKSFTPRSNPGNGGASFGNSSRSFGGGNRSIGGPTRSNGGGSHGSFGGRR